MEFFLQMVVLAVYYTGSTTAFHEFSPNFTGVVFSPYVMNAENGAPIPSLMSYSTKDLEAMINVVSTRFSKIFVESVVSWSELYVSPRTYFHETYPNARTAEVVARFNERNNKKSLSVMLGVKGCHDMNQLNMSTYAALDAVRTANHIYPETVEALVFIHQGEEIKQCTNHILTWLKLLQTVSYIKFWSHIKFGTVLHCDDLAQKIDPAHLTHEKILYIGLKGQIVKASDFVICGFSPHVNYGRQSAQFAFYEGRHWLLKYRYVLQQLKSSVEVMGVTYWPRMENDSRKRTQNLVDYWIEVDKFALKLNYTMWLHEAIDNPFRDEGGVDISQNGWWRLKGNDLVGQTIGYTEKISEYFAETKAYQNITLNGTIKTEILMPTVGYVGVAIGVLALVFLLGFMCYIFSGFIKLKASLKAAEGSDGNNASTATPSNYTMPTRAASHFALNLPYDSALELSEDMLDIKHNQILGEGHFSIVYKATLKDKLTSSVKEVALKTAKYDNNSEALKGILDEIKILSYLKSHPNIVSICGAFTANIKNGKAFIAIEMCSFGSLKAYLCRIDETCCSNPEDNTISNLTRWSYEIVCGMEYLEEKNVVHADLATRNVLLTSEKLAKIADFGLSRRLYEYSVYVKKGEKRSLPWRWMAIEALKQLEFSVQTDVWSYGVTLWEIFSLGDLPYYSQCWEEEFIDAIDNGHRLPIPKFASKQWYDIMRKCWDAELIRRPYFSELKVLIERLLIYCG